MSDGQQVQARCEQTEGERREAHTGASATGAFHARTRRRRQSQRACRSLGVEKEERVERFVSANGSALPSDEPPLRTRMWYSPTSAAPSARMTRYATTKRVRNYVDGANSWTFARCRAVVHNNICNTPPLFRL